MTDTQEKDPRIVYGANCMWWDSINNAIVLQNGLPCCPHCGSVLFEMESEKAWLDSVEKYIEKTGDEVYREFVQWLKGKCFPKEHIPDKDPLEANMSAFYKAAAQFKEETGKEISPPVIVDFN